MGYHGWCWVVRGIALLGAIAFVAGILRGRNLALCIAGVLLFAAAMAVANKKCRCPCCGKMVPERLGLRQEHCPYCGQKLD